MGDGGHTLNQNIKLIGKLVLVLGLAFGLLIFTGHMIGKSDHARIQVEQAAKVPIEATATTRARRSLMNSYVEAAQDIASRSGDSEALSISQIFQSGVLCYPSGNTLALAEETNLGQNILFFLPLLPSDRGVEMVENVGMTSDNILAMFVPEANVIILKTEDIGPLTKGLTLLHEGYHAHMFHVSPYEDQDPGQYYAEEVSAYEFETRVLALMGGDSYRKVLIIEQERIGSEWIRNDQLGMSQIPFVKESYPELEEIFGPMTGYDEQVIGQLIWMNACFNHIEVEFPEKVLDYKRDLILTFMQ
jgi:hypothetical protein